MSLSKAARLAEFYDRLAAASPCRSAEEALAQISQTLNAVEDEHSGVPYRPDQFASDGRLYPPQEDNRYSVPERPDLLKYRSAQHYAFVSERGAISIRRLDGSIEFSKPGADGAEVEL